MTHRLEPLTPSPKTGLVHPSPSGELADESRQLRTRLDTATALEETTRTYVERLESMVDEQRLPSGDDLIGEIERFLREGGTEGRPQS